MSIHVGIRLLMSRGGELQFAGESRTENRRIRVARKEEEEVGWSKESVQVGCRPYRM